MDRRRLLVHAVQLLALGGVLWFLTHTALAHREALASLRIAPAALPLLAASLIVVAKDLGLVGGWVYSLRWWGARLRYLTALRIWVLSNLARFVPGGIWQFAGMTAMAVASGVSPVATTGAVLLQQAVILATGLALTLALAPHLLADWVGWSAAPTAVALLVGALALVALVVLLPAAAPALGRLVGRLFRRPIAWPAPPTGEFGRYVSGLLVHWLAFGSAFWLFGVALLRDEAPSLAVALTAFVASYVAGILVVVAPGGLGVRESALVVALQPHIGPERALLLAIGSRLWMFGLEALTALAAVVAHRVFRSVPQS